jgi:hypothetical protein
METATPPNPPPSNPGYPPPRGDGDLLARLRAGRTAIVIRHAATDRSEEDADSIDVDDCSTQRNLTEEGRADSERIGDAIRDLRVPIGAVLSSVYCRAVETGELAFGRAQVAPELDGRVVWPPSEETRGLAGRRLERLIRERLPESGADNTVMVVHQLFPEELDGTSLEEGEAAVYTVRGGEIVNLGELAPDEWAGLESNRVTERVQDSVVSVQLREGEHAGAGFRVGVEGIVVTNAQVAEDADEVSVVLRDGTQRTARVLGRAPDVDVAVLELENDSGLPPLHSGSGLDDARVGDRVLAVGSPLEPRDNVASGSLIALDRSVRLGEGTQLELLQTDAAIGPAIAGGPLINAQGEVLGVSTAIAGPGRGGGSTGAGFAIPVDVARGASLAIVSRRR